MVYSNAKCNTQIHFGVIMHLIIKVIIVNKYFIASSSFKLWLGNNKPSQPDIFIRNLGVEESWQTVC